jgi:hypothetical protein
MTTGSNPSIVAPAVPRATAEWKPSTVTPHEGRFERSRALALCAMVEMIACGGELAGETGARGDGGAPNGFGHSGREAYPDAASASAGSGLPDAALGALDATNVSHEVPGDASEGSDAGDGDTTDAASAHWCSSQGTHVFCEDFTDGIPGRLADDLSVGSSVTPDMGKSTATSPAMLATTPPLTTDGGQSWAYGSHTTTVTGAHFRLQADVRVDSSCFDNGYYDRVTVLGVEYASGNYVIKLYVTPAVGENGIFLSAGIVEFNNGEAAYGAEYGWFSTDEWETMTLWADEPSSGGLSVSPAGIAAGGGIFGGQGPYQEATLRVGASTQNVQSHSSGCEVSVDNVLFDIGDAHIY